MGWLAGLPWSVQIWIGTAVATGLAIPLAGVAPTAFLFAGALTGLIARAMYE
jgi:hypothetical protein